MTAQSDLSIISTISAMLASTQQNDLSWPFRSFLSSAFVLWLIGMFAVAAVAKWRDHLLPQSVSLAILFQIAFVVAAVSGHWEPHEVLQGVACIALLGWSVEWLGLRTALPFGRYQYMERLRPTFLGVPLIVAVAYVAFLVPSWAVADRLLNGSRGWDFVLLSSLAATVWDLFIDPQAVRWGFWRWNRNGVVCGIPISNFAGWFAVSVLLTLVVQPGDLPTTPLVTVYFASWMLETVAHLFLWRLMPSGVLAGLLMGSLALAAVLRS